MTSTPRIDAYLLAHHVADTTAFLDLARQLERELAAASQERDKALLQLTAAKHEWLDRADPNRGPYVAWEDYAAANAESQRWQAIAAQMSAEREHNANRAGWLAAELAAARKATP